MKKSFFKSVAKAMLVTLAYQLVFPACAYALTTGPSQPEVQSFEPVGTTEMVDMFTGDFNYNIPLMDVEGYPVNIFYHSGVGIEQESSWVGLGWNINPGEINRSVRGLPDDFNGETIEKTMNIKEEVDFRIGVGGDLALELFGKNLKELGLNISLGGSLYLAHNNYRGLSSGISTTVGLSCPVGSLGIGLGVGTQSGADKDLFATLKTPSIIEKSSLGVSVNAGVGYNSRAGLKDISIGVSAYMQTSQNNKRKTDDKKSAGYTVQSGMSASTTIPIGVQNYVPVITNKMVQKGLQVQLKAGFSAVGLTASCFLEGMKSEVKYEKDASKNGYGYLYLQNSNKEDILDFSREKDGVYNKTLQNLPASTLNYDIYSVNAQGAGGMFRPFRNDIGTIYDPYVSPEPSSNNKSLQSEVGVPGPDYAEGGTDFTYIQTRNQSGPWVNQKFSPKGVNNLYENVFFKHAGELTYNQQQEISQIFNSDIQYVGEDLSSLISKGKNSYGNLPSRGDGYKMFWNGGLFDRSSRATNISFQTAEQIMRIPDMDMAKKIVSYSSTTADPAYQFYNPKMVKYDRFYTNGATPQHNANQHHISEFTQTMPDGRRYVYGIPAMNNVSKEVTFAINEENADVDLNTGYVNYTGAQASESNNSGRDNFYSSTVTPGSAHSYLLTSLLSNDYVDILGDGPSDDDLGTFVKYNYELKCNDYRWKTPYPANKAQYNPGYWSDKKDGKGNFLIGSRQQWYVRSMETKNYVAEFYTSPRIDGKGVKDAILTDANTKLPDIYKSSAAQYEDYSYKLDSIKLYNKHDRYLNSNSATPIKTVIFSYSYNLCKNTPNSFLSATPSVKYGKLTLDKIFIQYGNSQKNLLSPYVFEYKGQNPNYNFAAKDRWGNYKKEVSGVHNYEFPYTEQPDIITGDNSIQEQSDLLSSWNLTDIKLPSGGKIHVDYESDDYSFVQEKRSMQMLRVVGVGSSEKMVAQTKLYADKDNVNDYIYFLRRTSKEIPGLSLRDNYLEGQTLLYYSFSLDVSGTGQFEHINGYGKIDKVGICEGNPNYGFVKLLREDVDDLKISPISLLGINTGRYYLPHVFYDGYSVNDGYSTLKSLAAKVPELFRTVFNQNPFKSFLKHNKANNIQLANSWIRVQTPGLTKKGGGIRVKQLTLSDNWKSIAGNEDSKYGKKYDYTIDHDRYGKISSGVASYEPMIGADENPFRNPVPYSAEKGRGMPSVDFFQEEPFGESFFPAASVGYSNVEVSSIHSEYGRSSQAMDEYQFYTAKDFPIRVDFSEKDPSEIKERTLRKQYIESKVLQGYIIQMNDMHGKPKSVNNYVVHKKESGSINELITSNKYNYNVDNQGRLDNNVTALVRKRGSQNTFEIRKVLLGQDVEFTVDSRMRESATTSNKKMFGVNVLQILGVPTPVPSLWKSQKSDTKIFKSLVSTKIVQQYGILKSVEFVDHGSKTITENMIYDSETGSPLLTKTNNEYSDYTCNLSHPAYLAYEGMRPSYTNDGYEEISDSLVINYGREGYLYTNNFVNFTNGDELLVEYGSKDKKFMKLWVTGIGTDTSKPKPVILPDSGLVSFAKVIPQLYQCYPAGVSIVFNVKTTSNPSVTTGFISKDIIGNIGLCSHPDAVKRKLPAGDYTVDVVISYSGGIPASVASKTFTVKKGTCTEVSFNGYCRNYGQIIVKKHHIAEMRASDFELTPNFYAGTLTLKRSGKLFSGNDYEFKDCSVMEGEYTFKYNDGRDKWHTETVHIVPYKQNEIMIKVNHLVGPEILTYTRDLPDECLDGGKEGGSGGGYKIISVNVTETTEGEGDVVVSKPLRCGLKVSPRFKDKISGTTNYSTWPKDKAMYQKVAVKVLRSGRRNNLNQSVQQTTFKSVGDNNDISNPETLNKLFDKTSDILNMGVNTFTDSAQIYGSFTDEMDVMGDYKYRLFNPYVLGQLGNFRPLASNVPVAQRDYAQQYTRTAGVFKVPSANQFWKIINSRLVASTACDGKTDLLSENTLTGTQFWKMASKIVRYDIFGNALEEQDAIGNYSSAQYGYNKALPVSVASNARYQQFMFDGFEEYNMLLPQKIAALFLKGDLYTAFGTYFGNITSGSLLARYGQNFYIGNLTPVSSPVVLTRDANHTGYYSMYANSATTIPFIIGDAQPNTIDVFKFSGGKKYLLQLWAHKTSSPVTAGMFKANINGSTDMNMILKTSAIDGWYLVEAILDLSSVATGNVNLKLPAGTYVDDIRAMPLVANMKSFVYDPITFKLMAQLDENHMSTFFEYDQEGLLVRTKKETQNGIVTISESRRANNKPVVEETPDAATTVAEELRPTGSPY